MRLVLTSFIMTHVDSVGQNIQLVSGLLQACRSSTSKYPCCLGASTILEHSAFNRVAKKMRTYSEMGTDGHRFFRF